MHLAEGFSYQFQWTPALSQRALRTVPGRGVGAPIKLTLPVWFWFLLLAAIMAPLALLGFGVIGPQAVYAYPFGLVAGGILVGAFFWIIQHHLVAGTGLREPSPMQVTIAPSGVFLATAHFRNEYTWQAVDRVAKFGRVEGDPAPGTHRRRHRTGGGRSPVDGHRVADE